MLLTAQTESQIKPILARCRFSLLSLRFMFIYFQQGRYRKLKYTWQCVYQLRFYNFPNPLEFITASSIKILNSLGSLLPLGRFSCRAHVDAVGYDFRFSSHMLKNSMLIFFEKPKGGSSLAAVMKMSTSSRVTLDLLSVKKGFHVFYFL